MRGFRALARREPISGGSNHHPLCSHGSCASIDGGGIENGPPLHLPSPFEGRKFFFFAIIAKGLPKNLARHHSQVGRVDQRPIFDYFMTVKSALVLAGTGWRGLGGLIGGIGRGSKRFPPKQEGLL